MTKSIFTIFFFCATAAFAQTGTVLMNTPQPYQPPDHPQHASQHSMAEESSLLSLSSYSYGKGEVPLADLASPIYEIPLGDLARTAKKEHASLPKAVKVFED